jgi:hypothetical protein
MGEETLTKIRNGNVILLEVHICSGILLPFGKLLSM